MAQRRQRQGGFRFSLPWMTSEAVVQPKPPQPPVVEAKSTPAHRQPPRVVPSQNSTQKQITPPRAQLSKDVETQKPSSSRASTQPRAINSQPPSPSRISPQLGPPLKTMSPSQTTAQTRTPTQRPSPSTITRKPLSPPKSNPLSTPTFNKKEKHMVEPKPEVESKKDEETQESDGNSEEKTRRGKEIVQEHNDGTVNGNDKRATLSSSSKKLKPSHKILASDDEQTHVGDEDVIRTKDTLNSTTSDEYPKNVVPDVVDKDQARTYHHKNTTPSDSRPMHKGIQEDISKFVHKMTNEKQNISLGERQISVITLTGDNRGALMTIGHEPGKKEGKINIHRGYKVNPHENSDSTTDGEKSTNEESEKDSKMQEGQGQNAYINNNIQIVNNSIMFKSSITERNPGVHYTVSTKVMEHVDETKTDENLKTHDANFSVARSQKLSHKPVVRRRCLKGLFMEPSDSDPDNPEKPRRHGCRVACGEKNKIDVL